MQLSQFQHFVHLKVHYNTCLKLQCQRGCHHAKPNHPLEMSPFSPLCLNPAENVASLSATIHPGVLLGTSGAQAHNTNASQLCFSAATHGITLCTYPCTDKVSLGCYAKGAICSAMAAAHDKGGPALPRGRLRQNVTSGG